MRQTREHLEILSLLGLDRGIVALTKADLVSPERLEEAASKVREMLAGCPSQDSEIVPVSSVTGEGIAALEAQLTMAALNCGEDRAQGEFRLAIDRSFVLAGVGVVVTGTVAAGTVSVGDRAMLTPSGIEVRIRGIRAHNRAASTGRAGERCALNLAGAQVNRERVRRGDWVVAPSLHAPTNRLDVGLHLLCHDGKPLVGGIGVHLHLGTARTGARLFPLALEIPTPGAMVPARLVLEQAIGALCGDRLILRNTSASRTIGGGVVRDPYLPARG
jgi:selenocysteine-specific elongation factor